jgi:hypothetical protein
VDRPEGGTVRGQDPSPDGWTPDGFWAGFERGRAAAEGKAPPLRLSRAIKARLLKRFGGTARSRIGASAGLRALSVLLKRHPDAALDMAGAAALDAGRSGLSELKRLLVRKRSRGGQASAGLSPPEGEAGRATM